MFSVEIRRASSPVVAIGTLQQSESFVDLVNYNSLKPNLCSIAQLKNPSRSVSIDIYNGTTNPLPKSQKVTYFSGEYWDIQHHCHHCHSVMDTLLKRIVPTASDFHEYSSIQTLNFIIAHILKTKFATTTGATFTLATVGLCSLLVAPTKIVSQLACHTVASHTTPM